MAFKINSLNLVEVFDHQYLYFKYIDHIFKTVRGCP